MPKVTVEQVDALRNAFNAQVVSHQPLNVGDVVIVNPAVSGIFKRPSVEQPGIIIEFLPKPLFGFEIETDISPGSPVAAIKFDCVINVVDEDGDIIPVLTNSKVLIKATA